MKKRHWWILGAAALLAVAGVLAMAASYLFGGEEAAWTTRSRAAEEQFERGLEAFSRQYSSEAIKHFDRALELDPKFVSAKLFLSWLHPRSSAQSKDLVAELVAADLDRLNPRERFLTRYSLAHQQGRHEEAAAILSEFRAAYPDDLFGLREECGSLWIAQDWDAAEACYLKLIDLHPNSVVAYDRLGFIDMAQGRFSEAEEHFRTYRYIAPDQAMPYLSLAELLNLLGRYEEAHEALREALAIKDDFCPAHYQLMRTYYLSGRLHEAQAVLERMEEIGHCAGYRDEGFFCRSRGLIAFFRGDFEQAWSWFEGDCLERRRGFDLVAHHVAVATGRLDEAEKIEERLHAMHEMIAASGRPAELDWYASACAHLEGVQLLAAGDDARASQRLREADEQLKYWIHGQAGFKLLNGVFLARSLELAGQASEARAARAKVEAVNRRFPVPELSFLAPARR